MHPPAGVHPLRSLAAACVVLTAVEAWAEEEAQPPLRQAITRDLPRYDPAAYEKAQQEKAARSAPKNAPAPLPETKLLPGNPAEHGVPGTNPGPAAAGNGVREPEYASVAVSEGILALPTVTVHPNTDPPKPLPRLDTFKPIHDTPGESFESGKARDARLVRNHLTTLEQAFYRIFHVSPVAAARQAEAEKEKARQMNELAAGIEIQEALGRDPAEIKKLRAEYTKLYYSGPK